MKVRRETMKYFFFDIDGTLTDIRNGHFIESAIATINELEEKGNFVAIATGRALYKAFPAMKEAQIHNMVCNGGACLVVNDKVIRNRPLDRDKALAIIHECNQLGYGILIAFDDSQKVIMKDHRFIEQVGERQEPTEYILKKDLDFADLKDIYKIYISISVDEEHKLTHLNDLGHMRFVKDYLMYQHDAKDQGIRDMLDYLHGDSQDVVVFGDGENDRVMFKPEWTSIAMGNGDETLKKMASYVTSPSYEDGIKKACQHFGWIQ